MSIIIGATLVLVSQGRWYRLGGAMVIVPVAYAGGYQLVTSLLPNWGAIGTQDKLMAMSGMLMVAAGTVLQMTSGPGDRLSRIFRGSEKRAKPRPAPSDAPSKRQDLPTLTEDSDGYQSSVLNAR
jgi:hypothetical protein